MKESVNISFLGLHEFLDMTGKSLVSSRLARMEYNLSRTARSLKIHRNTLMRRLNAWGWNRKLRRFQ